MFITDTDLVPGWLSLVKFTMGNPAKGTLPRYLYTPIYTNVRFNLSNYWVTLFLLWVIIRWISRSCKKKRIFSLHNLMDFIIFYTDSACSASYMLNLCAVSMRCYFPQGQMLGQRQDRGCAKIVCEENQLLSMSNQSNESYQCYIYILVRKRYIYNHISLPPSTALDQEGAEQLLRATLNWFWSSTQSCPLAGKARTPF